MIKKLLVLVFAYVPLQLCAQNRLIINPGGHTSVIPDAVASHDGKFLVSVSHDKSVKVWSAEAGNLITEFFGSRGEADEGMLYCLALSPDDQLLAVAGYLIEVNDQQPVSFIRIYDLKKKKLKSVLRGHTNVINSLDFSPDGQYLASASSDGHVIVWNMKDLSVEKDITAHESTARMVRFAGNKKIVSGGWDEKLNLIDVETGHILKSVKNCGKISGICYNGKHDLVLSYADGSAKVQVWNMRLEKQEQVDVFQPLACIATRGDFLIVGQERYPYTTSVFYYEDQTFKPATLFNGLDNSVTACGFVNDQTAWSAGGSANEIVFYPYWAPDEKGNITLASPVLRLRGYGHSVCAVGYTQQCIGFADVKCNAQYGQATLTHFFDLNTNKVYQLNKSYEHLFRNIDTVQNGYSLQHSRGGLLSYPNATLTLRKDKQPLWQYTLDEYSGFRHSTYAFAGNKWVLSGSDDISVVNYQGQQRATLKGHEGDVLGLWTDSLGHFIFSAGRDQTIRLWDISDLEDKTYYMPYEQLYENSKTFFRKKYPHLDFSNEKGMETLYKNVLRDFGDDTAHYLVTPKKISPMLNFFIGLNSEWVIWSEDGYYKSSREGSKFVAYFIDRGKDKDAGYYPFEQFDLKYNRPDIINQRLGIGDSSFNASLKKAHERRLEKMGLKETDLSGEKHLPVTEIVSAPENTEEDHYDLEVSCSDELYFLYKLHVYNNDVPVFGASGYALPAKNLHRFKQKLIIPLVTGENRISVSVVNEKGVESLREEISVFCSKRSGDRNLYVVAIGASEYQQQQFNLSYAAKDARDVAELFKKSKAFDSVFTLTLTNEQVNNKSLASVEEFLGQASANDGVIVFAAGHGVLDKNFDYYLAAHDMDFNDPAGKGISYARLEQILDRVKSLKKLLFLDTCHSGEVDKDDITAAEQSVANTTDLKFRNVGMGVQHKSLGVKQTTELMKEVFTDLRKGTGAHVISSAGGYELAMEGRDWKNGLFTYVLIEALTHSNADANKDGSVSISELKAYVCQGVAEKSNGVQVPTSRMENIRFDFRVW